MKISRRQTMAHLTTLPALTILSATPTKAALAAFPIAPPGGPSPTPAQVFGTQGAPYIEEFFAWNCSHCAHFFLTKFPDIRSQLIEARKIRWFGTPIVADQPSMTASLIARAIQQDQLLAFTQAMFAQQNTWTTAKNPVEAVIALAQTAGIQPAIIASATRNPTAREIIFEQTYRAANIPIRGTPSFYMNGKIVAGDISLGHLAYEFALDRLDPLPPTAHNGSPANPPQNHPDIPPSHLVTPSQTTTEAQTQAI